MVIGGLVHTMFIGSVISKLYQVDVVEYDKTKYFLLFPFAIEKDLYYSLNLNTTMSLILNKLILSLLNFQVNYLIETLIMQEAIIKFWVKIQEKEVVMNLQAY